MTSRIANARVDAYSHSWRPGWRGSSRFVMLTSSLLDAGRFVAYGTDGFIAFRVEGSWRRDLSSFLAQMDADGVELIPPPHVALALPSGHPTYPDPITVQRCLDARVGMGAAA
jgi:hypothetical protein